LRWDLVKFLSSSLTTLLISVFQVASIIGVRHYIFYLKKIPN
jgi:hypothetical protein